MSGRVLRFEGSAHAEADRLLPWLANGTLEGDELALVRAHLGECASCRRELAWLRSLQAECTADAPPRHAPGASRRLHQRLAKAKKGAAPRRRLTWQHAVIAAQAALLLTLGVALLRAQPPVVGAYHTLGAPAAARDRLVVVFDPGLSEMAMRQLLQACDARVVDGPTAAGAWVLSVPTARAATIREALRAAPGVTLVERLDPAR